LRQSVQEVEKTTAELITARQQAELRRSEIESIINATEDYIIAFDNELKINYFNQAGYTLLKSAGKTPVCGDAIDAFKDQAFFQEVIKKTAAVVADKKPVRFELALSVQSQEILLYVSINPIIQKGYQLGGLVVIARDTTPANMPKTQ
jgi:nitrogen fixation/metabolism regulation signal transduction histidine kinase